MSKKQDDKPVVVTDKRQAVFEFVEPTEYEVEFVGLTPEGYGLYRRMEGHGGYRYWTDEIPPAICVHDEGLSNLVSTFAALDHLGQGETLWKHLGAVFGYKQ